MVDATLLRKNCPGMKRKGRRSIQDERIDGNTPLDLSCSANSYSEDILKDSTTQLFYVFNPPTQTYEPITIISLGEEIEPVSESLKSDEILYCSSNVNNDILTDHEEIVQTCEENQVNEEVMICNTFDSDIEREEIVDVKSRELDGHNVHL